MQILRKYAFSYLVWIPINALEMFVDISMYGKEKNNQFLTCIVTQWLQLLLA